MTTNNRIALNTLATYGRSLVVLGFGLFSSRWILAALGDVDFSLYGVVGSIIVFITFFNGVREYCQQMGADWAKVHTGCLLSGYINDTHTYVPGPDGKLGYGGKCFPKDVNAFAKLTEGTPPPRHAPCPTSRTQRPLPRRGGTHLRNQWNALSNKKGFPDDTYVCITVRDQADDEAFVKVLNCIRYALYCSRFRVVGALASFVMPELLG